MDNFDDSDNSCKKTLYEFGYQFVDGVMKSVDNEEGFVFNIHNDHHKNQLRYNIIGECLNEYVYGLLEKEGLKRIYLKEGDEHAEFVYASADIRANDRLVILIHGSGVVRAGQWARRLIMNDNLTVGTQIPYIREAISRGYSILLLNTNLGDELHAQKAWDLLVEDSAVKRIAIVAHSFGGMITGKLFDARTQSFSSKVFAISFTDSVHGLLNKDKGSFYSKYAINWASSNLPLDTQISSHKQQCRVLSAGTRVHEYTSSSCMSSVFSHIDAMETGCTSDTLEND